MNDLFFFIKYILKDQPNLLIYFIIFNIIPKKGIEHFHNSIYGNLFISATKKKELMNIFFKASYHRYKIKRLVHLYKWKKAKSAEIIVDLYNNPLSSLRDNQKITILQNKTIFRFRLSDLLTMWVNTLTCSDNLFTNPGELKNPYTGIPFKVHNLYNIFFSLHNSSFHIPSLISDFFAVNFSLIAFKIRCHPRLREAAIKNYFLAVSEEDKFIDILDMLDVYDVSHNLRNNVISYSHQTQITKDLCPFLRDYYITQYSCNPFLKGSTSLLLRRNIEKYISNHSLIPNPFILNY